jgi:hypothetical protein
MAQNQNKSQKEYNDLLDMTQSMLGKMNSAMSDLESKSDKRNKKLSEQISLTQEILKSVETMGDLEAAINLIKENNVNISKKDFGINNKLLNTFLAQQDALGDIMKRAQKTQNIFERVDDIVSETTSKFSGGIDDVLGKLEDIPIVGKALKNYFQPFADTSKKFIEKTASKFTSGFQKAFGVSKAGGAGFAKSLSVGLKGGLASIRGMVGVSGKLLSTLSGVTIGIGLIVGGLMLGVARFKEIGAAAKSFRQSTGLLNSQTKQTKENIASISRDFAGLGVNASDVADAAAEFTNTFSGLEQPAKSTLESMVVMNKNFGVSLSDAAELNKLFQNMGGLTEAQAQSLSMSVVEMSKLAGVAPSKVIADLAKNSGKAYEYFRGSPQELAKAAVSLAAMGSSLESATKSSEALLNFESSITSELEANALLGARINLDKARAAAFSGDLYGQEKAIMEQMAQIGDISKMDVFRKQALAKATGKEIDELENLQRIQKRFPGIDEDRLASVNALLDAGKDISKLTTADLDAQTERMALDKEMQGSISNMTNKISEIGTAFMDMLMPIGEFIMPVLVDIADVLGAVLIPAFRIVGSILGAVFSILGSIWGLFSAILKPVVIIGMVIIESILAPFVSLFDIISMGFNYLTGLFKSISEFVTQYIIAPFQSFINSISNLSGIAQSLGFGNVNAEVTESVNDGVIQNGKVISTNPMDTIIATKTPEDLAGASAGGEMGSLIGALTTLMTTPSTNTAKFDELISEIKALRGDLSSGKIGINMDGKKVTNGISKVVTNTSSNAYALR